MPVFSAGRISAVAVREQVVFAVIGVEAQRITGIGADANRSRLQSKASKIDHSFLVRRLRRA